MSIQSLGVSFIGAYPVSLDLGAAGEGDGEKGEGGDDEVTEGECLEDVGCGADGDDEEDDLDGGDGEEEAGGVEVGYLVTEPAGEDEEEDEEEIVVI